MIKLTFESSKILNKIYEAESVIRFFYAQGRIAKAEEK